MGVVTGSAFAIAGGIMFESGGLELLLKVIVALKAHFGVGLEQQLFVIGVVRIVAGDALVVLDWLMLHLGGSNLFLCILVTFEAQFPVRFGQ